MTKFPEYWKLYPEIWPTKASFFVWMRGAFRRALWEKWPVKIQHKNRMCTVPPRGKETRAKTGTYCALSGKWYGKSALEVDHIEGNASLRDFEDIVPFIRHLLALDEELQLVGKEEHKAKSYAERQGLTFEEAVIEKEVIKFKKTSTEAQKEYLRTLGCGDIILRNATTRADAFREYLTKGSV